jgi:hypothetical protein
VRRAATKDDDLRTVREENLALRDALAGVSDLQDRLTKANECFDWCLAPYQQMRRERDEAEPKRG